MMMKRNCKCNGLYTAILTLIVRKILLEYYNLGNFCGFLSETIAALDKQSCFNYNISDSSTELQIEYNFNPNE